MKPLEKFIKKPWTFPVTLLFIGLISWGLYNFTLFYLDQTRPFKTKFPWEHGFDVTKFDLNDYKNHEELAEVFRHLFTPGVTTIADIDRVICNGKVPCGSNKKELNLKKSFSECLEKIDNLKSIADGYWYSKLGKNSFFGAWQVYALIDDYGKLLNMCSQNIPVFTQSSQQHGENYE